MNREIGFSICFALTYLLGLIGGWRAHDIYGEYHVAVGRWLGHHDIWPWSVRYRKEEAPDAR